MSEHSTQNEINIDVIRDQGHFKIPIFYNSSSFSYFVHVHLGKNISHLDIPFKA